MAEQDPYALNGVFADLQYAVSQARLVAGVGESLADDIEALIARYRSGNHMPAPGALTEAAEATSETSEPETDLDTFLEREVEEAEAAMLAAASPQDMTLHVRRNDGFPLTVEDARTAVEQVLPSIIDVVGELTVAEADVDTDDPAVIHVTLNAGAEANLAMLGAGKDAFNGDLYLVGVGDVTITSRVGDPADAELADELGMLPIDLPQVPEGQHAINGVLELIERETGVRPQAQSQFGVWYSKDAGDPLTEAEVRTILAHPISRGLKRLGASALLGIEAGSHPSVKIARFGLLEAGEIDLATLALQATQYRGKFNVPGVGIVTANGEAQLVDVDVDA